MNAINRNTLATLMGLCLALPACAQQTDSTPNKDAEPSTAEVMSSPQVRQAMAGAMEILKQMDATQGHAAQKPDARKDAASSDAMRDAASVARQAFGFAAKNPNATDAEMQAAANAMMSGIFSRELEGAHTSEVDTQEEAPPAPIQQGNKDYGDDDD